MVSFYSNKAINGDMSRKPHIVLTIAEQNYTEERGRVGYTELIGNAIKEHRVLDYNIKMRDDLSVIAESAGLGNITKSSLTSNLTHFQREIKAFK